MIRSRSLALLVLLAVAGCRGDTATMVAQPAAVSAAGLELVPLAIDTGSKVHRFVVEVARSQDEQARGLMFRQSLGPNEGMIFPFDPPRPAAFWMKNTVIPLDMIFVRADGTIARVAANTVPYSLDSVEVGEPVAAVLEIAGGRSAQLGIEPGNRVTWQSGDAR
jgi:uncharacterized protein